jgi:hypothetical protein
VSASADYSSLPPKIKVLIITGGHGFEHKEFMMFLMFSKISRIIHALQPQANDLIASENINNYDVPVFYDMVDSLNATQQKAYTAC